MRVGGQRQTSAALTPTKRHCKYCTGGWVNPRVGLEETLSADRPACRDSLYRLSYPGLLTNEYWRFILRYDENWSNLGRTSCH